MFKANKYSTWYFSIISNAKINSKDGYTEQHHIIPRSLGGTNDISNLVHLTYREHFICHKLLTKMTEGVNLDKMIKASWLMSLSSSKNLSRACSKISSRDFENIRTAFINNLTGRSLPIETRNKISASLVGNKNFPNSRGIPVSPKTRQKLSEAAKGKIISEQQKLNMSAAAKNRKPISEEHRQILSTAKIGKPRSEEAKKKIAEGARKRWEKSRV